MAEQLLCKDCKHFQFSFLDRMRGLSNVYGTCKLTTTTEVEYDYVNGKDRSRIVLKNASIERKYGECGAEGRFWVSEKKNLLFTLLKKI